MAGMAIGSFGVLLLLVAFYLNLRDKLPQSSKLYLLMNLVGSAMAAVYAVMTNSLPFVILETAWAMAALYGLLRPKEKAPH